MEPRTAADFPAICTGCGETGDGCKWPDTGSEALSAYGRFLGVDETIEIWAKEKLEKPLVEPEEFASKLQQLMGEGL